MVGALELVPRKGERAFFEERGAVGVLCRDNALKNGLVPVVVDAASHAAILAQPDATIAVDVETLRVTWPGGKTTFAIEPFARQCLLEGVDELGYLLARADRIAAYEAEHP